MERNIILHLFNWKLKDIIPQLQKIKESGYTAIQISPIQPCKNGDEWWKLYQIFGFRIGNKIGSKEELKELCKRANEIDLKIITDIVINHVAGKDNGELIPYKEVDKELVNNKYFWKENKLIHKWNDRFEVINYCCGLPSLRLNNYDLQNIVIKFMNELIDLGVSGFRIDSAKNIALPEEGSDFWIRVFNNLKRKSELFNYAEVIFENKELINKYSEYINVLTNSIGSDKRKLITFFMSHDTELEFKCTNKMNDNMIIQEWNYLLSNNRESHMLFYARPFSDLWKSEQIKKINLKR